MVPSCSKRLWNECAPVNLAATSGECAQVCTGATACGQRQRFNPTGGRKTEEETGVKASYPGETGHNEAGFLY